jgi:WD40 repeat protein
MACIFRSRASTITRLLALLSALLSSVPLDATAQLYEQPVLVVDPGMHTAAIKTVAADATGRFAVTGSYDKTVRVWSTTDGRLLQTIRMPVGSGDVGRAGSVAMSPDGDLVAVGVWIRTLDNPVDSIYLFEWRTNKLVAQITTLPNSAASLAFSPNGRYLAAGLLRHGLRVYDRDHQWTEAFRDTDYGAAVGDVAFDRDGRLATTNWDEKVRLYDSDFKLAVAPRDVAGIPLRIAFSPDDTTLAVGYERPVKVDLFDGRSLTPLPSPNLAGIHAGLGTVAWSKDGKTLYAGGRYSPNDEIRPVLAWADAGRGDRRTLPGGLDSVGGLIALPDGSLFVATMDPMVELLGVGGKPRWARSSPKAKFLGQDGKLGVSTDGTIVDFGFEPKGKSPVRFDVHSLKLSQDPLSDQQTIPPMQNRTLRRALAQQPFPDTRWQAHQNSWSRVAKPSDPSPRRSFCAWREFWPRSLRCEWKAFVAKCRVRSRFGGQYHW